MDESLQLIFEGMINQQQFENALDFLTSINIDYTPGRSTLQLVIFELLMKCEDARVLAEAHIYLCNLLEVFPPTEENHIKFYYDVLLGAPDLHNSELWTLFSEIVKSCLRHYKVYYITSEEDRKKHIPFPSCNFLLDYYLKILEKNFESFLDKRSIYADKLSCFLVKVFWPKSEIGSFNSNCITLLNWINDLYKTPVCLLKNTLLEKLHEILSLIVKYNVHHKHGLTDTVAFNSQILSEMVSNIMVHCKDAFSKLTRFKLFVTLTSPKYLQAKVCEETITEMLYKNNDFSLAVLTLEHIVSYFMLCFDTRSKKMRSFSKANGSKEKKSVKRVSMKKTIRGGTPLHELARTNQFADLLECLMSNPNYMNAKNIVGNTPLHEACSEKNFMCVQVLLTTCEEHGIPHADVKSINAEGQTPLHISVLVDDVNSAEEILDIGDIEVLSIADGRGNTPKDLIASERMKNLLNKYIPITEEAAPSSLENYGPPKFNSYTEYTIYLHALTILLSYYIDVFHLSNFIHSIDKSAFNLKTHQSKNCSHVSSDETVICSDDITVLDNLNDNIQNFIDLILKTASESELDIKLETIPLKLLAASLIVHKKDLV